ncbi:MAG: hypothetical protein ABJ308_08620 [Halieaceae bacterium]
MLPDPAAASTAAPGANDEFGSPALDFQEGAQPALIIPDATSYQFYITDLESRFGPYAPGLSEQLLGLGSAYQQQGLHDQAIDYFKRGVHIARVNGGLNGEQQIPLLQRLIRSLVAMGDFETADERQYYLFRVQANVYGRGSKQMSLAMLERAEWERRAYHLALGDTAFMRLLTMWELYSAALRNISREDGSHSQSLLRPLSGLLQTQYMISAYSGESTSVAEAVSTAEARFVEANRFSMVRGSNYKQGQAVIRAMREVYDYNEDEESPLATEALVQLGDWHQWHQKRDSALLIYQQAWDEFGELKDGERLREVYFGQPTLLPDLPGSARDLVAPSVVEGYASVSYFINGRGRVKSLELLEMERMDETDTRPPVRLLRRIKQQTFRPRLQDREPIATETIEKRYAY